MVILWDAIYRLARQKPLVAALFFYMRKQISMVDNLLQKTAKTAMPLSR
jgi:hypothetical protein